MLRTERLILRPPVIEDGPLAVDYMSDFDTVKMLSRVPYPYKNEDWAWFVEDWVKKGKEHVYAIEAASSGKFMGVVGLLPEEKGIMRLGYWLGSPHRRHGYMREAVFAILQEAFQSDSINIVRSGYFDDNLASSGLQEQIGFVFHAQGMDRCLATGEERAHTDTQLTKQQFRQLYPEL